MMIRRLTAALTLLFALGLFLAAPAQAGQSPAEILDEQIEPDVRSGGAAPGPRVLDSNLPRTGDDLGAEVVVGIGLVIVGGGLAVAARQRRNRVTVG